MSPTSSSSILCFSYVFIWNHFSSLENDAFSAISMSGANTDTLIRGNYIQGDYQEAPIMGTATTARLVRIENNTIYQGVFTGLNTTLGITLLTGSKGYAMNNRVIANLSNSSNAFNADGVYFIDNFYTESAGGSSTGLSIDLIQVSSTLDQTHKGI